MTNKFIKIPLCAMLTAVMITGCGSDNNNPESGQNKGTEEVVEDTAKQQSIDVFAEGDHDASEKDNEFAAALSVAKSADKGSTENVSGKYLVEGSEDTYYVFTDDTAYLLQTGEYSFSDNKISLIYGGQSGDYDITETESGFSLTYESVLLPLIYMEGTDGLTGTGLFDGIYSMGEKQGYVFHKDGTLDIITTMDFATDGETVTFDGASEDWILKDGRIVISTNGTVVMTLVPVE